MSETTFGCGDFLPGRGPYNFPDFIEGGTINNGGPSFEEPPTDPNTTTPPEDRECGCRPKALGTEVTFPLYTILGYKYFAVQIEKECTDIINGQPPDNSISIIQSLTAAITAIPRAELVSTDPGSEDCADPPPGGVPLSEIVCSDKECDPIIIIYRLPSDERDPGPTTPPGGGGPGVTAGPTSPRGQNCFCTITEPGGAPTYQLSSYVNGGVFVEAVWQRECVDRSQGNYQDSDIVTSNWLANNLPPGARVGTSINSPDERCNCRPDWVCEDWKENWFILLTVNTGDPQEPEPDPPPPPPGNLDPSVIPDNGGSGNVDVIGDVSGVIIGGDDPSPSSGPVAQPIPDSEPPGGGGVIRIDNQVGTGPPDIVGGGEGGEPPGIIAPVAVPDAGEEPNPLDLIIPTTESLTQNRTSRQSETQLVSRSIYPQGIDLTDKNLVESILNKRPAGVEDEEVFFNTVPKPRKLVKNTSKITDIFKKRIDESLHKLLTINLDYGSWDSTLAADITPQIIYNSLNEKALELIDRILNYDGRPLNISEIFSIIGSRVLDGTIKDVNISYLSRLAEASNPEDRFTVVKSSNSIVNETVALALIEKSYYPLDYQRSSGRGVEVLKNKKVLSSDIDKFIPVTIAGETRRYYVNDDDTFIGRNTLSLNDGDYFDVTLSGEVTRLYTQSEKDHAYFIPERTKQIALNLLGGETSRILSVSGDPRGIEVDYSLSSPRQNIYFLSCVLDSLETVPDPVNPKFLKRTRGKFVYVPIENINEINEYIKYKDNHQTFVLDDEDLLLDYVERDGELFLEQTDILLDSPKENKTLPLLTRQYPWYILLYPSNKPENNPFNSKSKITSYSTSSKDKDEVMTRQLRTTTTIIPNLRNKYNQFVSVELVGRGARDVFDEPDNDARINKINLTNPIILSGYVDFDKNSLAASEYVANRQKTGYRLLYEIITSLDNNYLLGLNGIGKSLTEFDVLCRLSLRQFNKLFRMENFVEMKRTLFNGSVSDVKVVPATKHSDSRISTRKTQLVRRKASAPEQDEFPEKKSTNFGRTIVPPTTEEEASFDSFEPPTPPSLLP
jgi:hypothetical protein